MLHKVYYKSSAEIFWICDVINLKDHYKVVDLGCGQGNLLEVLYNKNKALKLYGLEIQKKLYKNAKHLVPTAEVKLGNIKNIEDYFTPNFFDIVISNPPFYELGKGQLSPFCDKSISKHEILCNMEDILKAASFLLKKNGYFYIIYPIERLHELCKKLQNNKLFLKEILFIKTKNIKYFIAICTKLKVPYCKISTKML